MRVTVGTTDATVELRTPDVLDDMCRRAADLMLRCAAINAYTDSTSDMDDES